MFKISKYYPNILVDLEPGIYCLDTNSGQGKTWLATVLSQYSSYDEPVNSYSYVDYKRRFDIAAVLNNPNLQLLMIDRYDMLPPEISSHLDAATGFK